MNRRTLLPDTPPGDILLGDILLRRYDAYRAEAELNRNCRAPREFARGLVSAPSTWAAPHDRVTAWALYRLAQDAGAEPRVHA